MDGINLATSSPESNLPSAVHHFLAANPPDQDQGDSRIVQKSELSEAASTVTELTMLVKILADALGREKFDQDLMENLAYNVVRQLDSAADRLWVMLERDFTREAVPTSSGQYRGCVDG